jgi:hypothetical protein
MRVGEFLCCEIDVEPHALSPTKEQIDSVRAAVNRHSTKAKKVSAFPVMWCHSSHNHSRSAAISRIVLAGLKGGPAPNLGRVAQPSIPSFGLRRSAAVRASAGGGRALASGPLPKPDLGSKHRHKCPSFRHNLCETGAEHVSGYHIAVAAGKSGDAAKQISISFRPFAC